MGASATSEWLLARRRGTLDVVGNFYNHVTASLIQGELTQRGKPEYADAFNLDIGIRVEAKGRNSNNPFGIRISQKEIYDEEPPFPLTDTAYCLFSYNHRGTRDENGNRPSSLMRESHSRKSKYDTLAAHTVSAYFLDLRIINAMIKTYDLRDTFFAGRIGEHTLEIGRRSHLIHFKNGTFEEMMRSIGLSPVRWVRTVERIRLEVAVYDEEFDRVFTNTTSFKLVTVLPRSTHKRVFPTIALNAVPLR
jgi:hypothetical protein